MNSRRMKIVLTTVVAVFVFGVILALSRGDRSRDLVLSIEPVYPSADVTVYIGGAVEEPGLYSLPRGSRVAEALDLATPLETADTSDLELAQTLRDEQSIVVSELESMSSDSDTPSSEAEAASANSSLININQASETELQEIPGIGPALAERIVERRSVAGPYQSIDELSEVSGISERMVEELREFATVDQ